MFTRQILDVFRQQAATLGMALIAIKLNADPGDSLIVDALSDGYKLCDFLLTGKTFYNGGPTHNWTDSEVLDAFTKLVARQGNKEHLTILGRLVEEAPGMQTILAGMLHLAPANPTDLEAATVYCHELYQALSYGQ